MAKFKKIEETDNSGFGKYEMGTGGGKPFSTSNTRTTRENGKYRQANNNTMQPRNSDGTFGYKSQNGLSIDPKYGPSRGKTVNPLLTGGITGIKIEDVEKQFDAKSGEYWEKYKDKWYRKGSLKVGTDHKTRVAGESIWEIARQRYDQVKKEFGGKIEWDDVNKEWIATEKGGESETFSEVKKGRKSQSEKAAATTAEKTGEDTFVKETDDSISVKKGTVPSEKKQYNPHWKTNLPAGKGTGHTWKPKMATPTMTTAQFLAQQAKAKQQTVAPQVQPQLQNVAPKQTTTPQPGVSTVKVAGNQPQPQVQPQAQLKHSASEIAQLRKDLVASGQITQAELDQYDDKLLDDNWDSLVQ